MDQVLFDGKPAYKIKGTKKSNIFMSLSATMYDCEGDEIWIPNSLHEYNKEDGTIIIAGWFYEKLVKEGKL